MACNTAIDRQRTLAVCHDELGVLGVDRVLTGFQNRVCYACSSTVARLAHDLGGLPDTLASASLL